MVRTHSATSRPDSHMVQVTEATEKDLEFLIRTDLEVPEMIMKKKVAAGEVYVAQMYTLAAVEGSSMGIPARVSTPDVDVEASPPVKPLLQPTPTFQPSVNIEMLTQSTESFVSPSPPVPSPVLGNGNGNTATSSSVTPPVRTGSAPTSGVNGAVPAVTVMPTLDMKPPAMPLEVPKATPSPTHTVSSVNLVGHLRFGYLFDSTPFLYSVSASGAMPIGSTFTPTQVLARLIDHWELEMKGLGFPFVLASVDPGPEGSEEGEIEHLLKRMNYQPSGTLGFPNGEKEKVFVKSLADGQVRNPGANSY